MNFENMLSEQYDYIKNFVKTLLNCDDNENIKINKQEENIKRLEKYIKRREYGYTNQNTLKLMFNNMFYPKYINLVIEYQLMNNDDTKFKKILYNYALDSKHIVSCSGTGCYYFSLCAFENKKDINVFIETLQQEGILIKGYKKYNRFDNNLRKFYFD